MKEPTVAVIVVDPAASVGAKPLLLTVATEVVDELHTTPFTRSCDEPSVKIAVAVNCSLIPMPRVNPSGVTTIAEIVGVVTVIVVDPVIPLRVAEIVVVPAATAVPIPFTSTVAVAVEDELQVTRLVRSRLLPSL